MNFEIGKTIEQTSHFFQAPFSPKKVFKLYNSKGHSSKKSSRFSQSVGSGFGEELVVFCPLLASEMKYVRPSERKWNCDPRLDDCPISCGDLSLECVSIGQTFRVAIMTNEDLGGITYQ